MGGTVNIEIDIWKVETGLRIKTRKKECEDHTELTCKKKASKTKAIPIHTCVIGRIRTKYKVYRMSIRLSTSSIWG